MFKAVLVDDELWILKGIKKTFKWNENGFEVVLETTNPEETLSFILREKPDVVFTDVRMPNLSGIDLLKKGREGGSKAEFVIISGHTDFCYAKEAIKFGVFDYCVKPLVQEDADELLKRLKSHLSKKVNDSEVHEESDIIHKNINNIQFKELIAYIDEHYSEKLYLNDLASMFFLNMNYCCYLFKNSLNMTFSEYLTQIRLKEAAKLLTDPILTTEEIAFRVGYDDYFYFNKVFKKHFGMTPFKYRKNI